MLDSTQLFGGSGGISLVHAADRCLNKLKRAERVFIGWKLRQAEYMHARPHRGREDRKLFTGELVRRVIFN